VCVYVCVKCVLGGAGYKILWNEVPDAGGKREIRLDCRLD